MLKDELLVQPESSLPSDEKPKPLVLLTDSDGTIFHGNMKKVISEVIIFLKKTSEERSTIDIFFSKLGNNLPEETQKLLRPWLEKQESIPWATPAKELSMLQQTIASFFPLIEYQNTDLDAKTSCTALDVFRAVWGRKGKVIILTFNIYAPDTIRFALIKKGLSEEQARQITIICPSSDAILLHEQIYACEPPSGGQAFNKNGYIRQAQKVCREELKLTNCEYIFVDDCHAQAARSKSLGLSVTTFTGEYVDGQHWRELLSLVKNQQSRTPVLSHSSPESSFIEIGEEGGTPVLDSLSLSSAQKTPVLERSPVMQPTFSTPQIPLNPFPFSPWPSSASNSSSFFKDEQLSTSFSSVNRMISLRELDNPTIHKIVEETTELKQSFQADYARAEDLKQKMRVVIRAIEHFYPQIIHTSENPIVRFTGINPLLELQQWIQKLDELFINGKQNTHNQLDLIDAATACWRKLRDTIAISETSESRKSNLAATEFEKWCQHQLTLNSSASSSTSTLSTSFS